MVTHGTLRVSCVRESLRFVLPWFFHVGESIARQARRTAPSVRVRDGDGAFHLVWVFVIRCAVGIGFSVDFSILIQDVGQGGWCLVGVLYPVVRFRPMRSCEV